MSVNKAVLLGNLGADPKVKVFKDKNKVVTLSVATNSFWIDRKTNEKRESTEWHTVKLRNKTADVAEKYLQKGDKIYISGIMRTRKYIDNRGNTQSKTEVIGKHLKMIGGNVSQTRLDKVGIAAPATVAAPVSQVEKLEEKNDNVTSVDENTFVETSVPAPVEEAAPDIIDTNPLEAEVDETVVAEDEYTDVGTESPVLESDDTVDDESDINEVEVESDTTSDLATDTDANETSSNEDACDNAVAESDSNPVQSMAPEIPIQPYSDIPYDLDETGDSGVDDYFSSDSYYDINESVQFADSNLSLLADEFNREALEAQQQDSGIDYDEDLPDWLLP